MSFHYLQNINLETAKRIMADALSESGFQLGCEEILVASSLGRVTAEAVYAKISSPHYNACAMDGIALQAVKTFGATDTTPVTLTEELDFVRVDTGDPLPDHYDAVVMIEDIIVVDEHTIRLVEAAAPWQHVRQIGEDICMGEMILPSYTRITPSAMGALLAGGVMKLKVVKRPLVGIIPTGDELVKPNDVPRCGEIIEFNSTIFSAMLQEWGALYKVYDIVPDDETLLKHSVGIAADECDLVIVNAGSSAGRGDFTAKVLQDCGQLLIHGIAIKPGKPTILGLVKGKPFVGVPGYPVSGIIVMEEIVKPFVKYLAGMVIVRDKEIIASLPRDLHSSLKYQEFVRVKLGKVGDRMTAVPLQRGAGVVTSFVKADGIMEVPMNAEGLAAGSQIPVRLLKEEEIIHKTLVLTGSHDPLIDEAADCIKRRYRDANIASAHVGSMGGIMAIKRCEAHMAGIHLLDENTGKYNVSYINKYLSGEKIALIRGVERIQGLMVPKGNPGRIHSLKDLVEQNMRYVNRQKGSGTRILLDYLMKQHDIKPQSIVGYHREEFTHLSVAALVAAGSADAGLGIYSVAKIYQLDFIPLYEEQYDFIVQQHSLESVEVARFIDMIQSSEFADRLMLMGGYTLDGIGQVILVE